jgi:hypothetical protein
MNSKISVIVDSLAEYPEMKRFLLVTLAACVAIDLVVLWMLW